MNTKYNAIHQVPINMTITHDADSSNTEVGSEAFSSNDFVLAHNALNGAGCRVNALSGGVYFFDHEEDPADKAYGRRRSHGPYSEKDMIEMLSDIRLKLSVQYDTRDTF